MSDEFSKTGGGWIVSDDVIEELAIGGANTNVRSEYCCTVYNDHGGVRDYQTINAGSRAEATGKCIRHAQSLGCGRGSVSGGACFPNRPAEPGATEYGA